MYHHSWETVVDQHLAFTRLNGGIKTYNGSLRLKSMYKHIVFTCYIHAALYRAHYFNYYHHYYYYYITTPKFYIERQFECLQSLTYRWPFSTSEDHHTFC